MKFRTARKLLGMLALGTGLLGSVEPMKAAAAQARPPLPPGVAELARELGTADSFDDRDADITIEPSPGDRGNPSVALRDLIAEVEGLSARGDRRAARSIGVAQRAAKDAWHEFAAGSAGLDHLTRTTVALHRLVVALSQTVALGGPDTSTRLIQRHAADISSRLAGNVIRRADAGGVPAARLRSARRLFDLGSRAITTGQMVAAVVSFGNALKLAADTVTFDIALFQQNIVDAMAGQTVGHAFSIAYLGELYQGGEASGLARTVADAPQLNHSAAKEQHVASVSKTLTTIVLLHLLEAQGLTPEALVAPYLPSNWLLSAGANNLRFRHFPTHTSVRLPQPAYTL